MISFNFFLGAGPHLGYQKCGACGRGPRPHLKPPLIITKVNIIIKPSYFVMLFCIAVLFCTYVLYCFIVSTLFYCIIIVQIGTYQLAVMAKAMNKPVYAVAESLKFERIYPLNQKEVPNKHKVSCQTNTLSSKRRISLPTYLVY